MNQLGGKVRQPVRPTLSKTRVDTDVLPFNPPELAQPLPESVKEMWVSGGRGEREITYPVYLRRLLRLGGVRCGEQPPDRPAAEKCDELTPPHATPPDLRECQTIRWLTPALK